VRRKKSRSLTDITILQLVRRPTMVHRVQFAPAQKHHRLDALLASGAPMLKWHRLAQISLLFRLVD